MAGIHLFICSHEKESIPIWYGLLILLREPDLISVIGISRETPVDDPQLGGKRHELARIAAEKLAAAHMIIYDQRSGAFTITDLGRIAAKYYIRHSSIEVFNKEFRPKMTEADVLAMLSMSTEVCMFHAVRHSIADIWLV
jgi:antiviral helicase SLH1